jgi:arabinofuranosyltransferase
MGAPVVASVCMGTYVVRVGGDFMHARLLLPALFCLALPVFVVPWRRQLSLVVPMLGILIWAGTCALALRPAYGGTETFHGIVDERSQLSSIRGHAHVVSIQDQEDTNDKMIAAANLAAGVPPRLLYVPYDGWRTERFVSLPLPAGVGHGILAAHALGVTSHIAAQRGLVAQDLLGLADPITAHYALPDGRGRPGHEKWLPDAWIVGRFAAPMTQSPPGVSNSDVEEVRRALRCGPLRELRLSYSAPLTLDRMWRNLTGSIRRTTFRFSIDPTTAARTLCQTPTSRLPRP